MAAGFEQRREALVGLIYDAVLDASLWSAALEGLADITHSAAALMHGYCVDRKLYTFHNLGRIDPECKHRHELYHVTNPWMRSSRFPAGRIVHSDDLIGLPELKRTAFYDDVLRPQNLAHGTIVNVVSRPGFRVSLNVERSEKSGPFNERDAAILRSLLPHVRRACELRLRMHDYREAAQAERDALDALSTGIITFDAGQRVLFANSSARMRGEELSLRVVAGSDLSGPPGIVNGVRALLADAVRSGTAGTRRLSRPNGREIGLTVTPVRGRAFDHPSHHRTASPAAIALLVDLSHNGEAASALLAARHGLTTAELRVATALTQSSDMRTAAVMLGISRNTLKSHTKRIYAKIGVRGHAELVQSIADIARVLDPSM
ncbi:LuxR C-terminal-related transcriptional regulator [Bradyrhizobium xenonodulans]|uniref:LuxR C-terminal-related transcriptional regulator n=1 Tax=Bradyrhizobium xenonodulans TaxID=2736875 RepID=A0ABY7MUF3_9BRAD|nr:LuxR C-terminal-related transcriptional regulator [Bradyrhizobium xenonodulans]WBL81979.1 LuxR C-terminal-related transcriptional regulator [Bradyrhizobium xenonodulans]